MAYLPIEVQDGPDGTPYWTLIDASVEGVDLRRTHQFKTKHLAEEAADAMNGVEVDEEPD